MKYFCVFKGCDLDYCQVYLFPDYCEYPLLDDASLTASSQLVTREADKARLYGE